MTMALAAYRNLLQSIQLAFRGDTRMLQGAYREARTRFEQNRGVAKDSQEYQDMLAEAKDVATILRQNVVQGAGDGSDTYKLRIHEQTERGDNETIKMAGKKFNQLQQRPAKGHSA